MRRWVIENDWLEAIIALPLNIFYNTGIATYIWVLSNRKASSRKGKVALIDATNLYGPLRKNLGKKNCELGPEDIKHICEIFLREEESEHSKIFPNDAFGYWKVTVDRPLRLTVELDERVMRQFHKACMEASEEPFAKAVASIARELGSGPHRNFNQFVGAMETALKRRGLRMTAKRRRLMVATLGGTDAEADPVIKNVYKLDPDKNAAREALYGRYHQIVEDKPVVVEYEPDSELRDTEQVPFLEDGGIEAFFQREVLPHAADAWIDESKTAIGYEISFTRHFYRPESLRSLEEIEADIRALRQETEGLLEDVLVGSQS